MINLVILSNNMPEFDKELLLCKDDKIHIRLKDYSQPQLILGFVDKLTFLVTYILSGWLQTYGKILEDDTDTILQDFQNNCLEYKVLENRLIDNIPNCKGIYILPEYSKINPNNKLGFISDNYIPKGCLKTIDYLDLAFQRRLNSNEEALNKYYNTVLGNKYLFDDNIAISLIDDDLDSLDLYSKYKNKKARQRLYKDKGPKVVNLWENLN